MLDDQPSSTAELVCSWRALETLLPAPRRIGSDPFARGFLGPARGALVDLAAKLPSRALHTLVRQSDRALQGVMSFVLARHRAIDELIAAGPWEQVVLLGAGYDSRRVRLRSALGAAIVFEVDHPATAGRKAELAPAVFAGAASAATRFVSVDFARESLRERLLEGGLAPDRRTVWAWEGVTMYLDEASVRSNLALIHELSGPGSQLAMDVWCPPTDRIGRFFQRSAPALAFRLVYDEPLSFSWPVASLWELLFSQGLRLFEAVPAERLINRYQARRPLPLELGSSMTLVVATCGQA